MFASKAIQTLSLSKEVPPVIYQRDQLNLIFVNHNRTSALESEV